MKTIAIDTNYPQTPARVLSSDGKPIPQPQNAVEMTAGTLRVSFTGDNKPATTDTLTLAGRATESRQNMFLATGTPAAGIPDTWDFEVALTTQELYWHVGDKGSANVVVGIAASDGTTHTAEWQMLWTVYRTAFGDNPVSSLPTCRSYAEQAQAAAVAAASSAQEAEESSETVVATHNEDPDAHSVQFGRYLPLNAFGGFDFLPLLGAEESKIEFYRNPETGEAEFLFRAQESSLSFANIAKLRIVNDAEPNIIAYESYCDELLATHTADPSAHDELFASITLQTAYDRLSPVAGYKTLNNSGNFEIAKGTADGARVAFVQDAMTNSLQTQKYDSGSGMIEVSQCGFGYNAGSNKWNPVLGWAQYTPQGAPQTSKIFGFQSGLLMFKATDYTGGTPFVSEEVEIGAERLYFKKTNSDGSSQSTTLLFNSLARARTGNTPFTCSNLFPDSSGTFLNDVIGVPRAEVVYVPSVQPYTPEITPTGNWNMSHIKAFRLSLDADAYCTCVSIDSAKTGDEQENDGYAGEVYLYIFDRDSSDALIWKSAVTQNNSKNSTMTWHFGQTLKFRRMVFAFAKSGDLTTYTEVLNEHASDPNGNWPRIRTYLTGISGVRSENGVYRLNGDAPNWVNANTGAILFGGIEGDAGSAVPSVAWLQQNQNIYTAGSGLYLNGSNVFSLKTATNSVFGGVKLSSSSTSLGQYAGQIGRNPSGQILVPLCNSGSSGVIKTGIEPLSGQVIPDGALPLGRTSNGIGYVETTTVFPVGAVVMRNTNTAPTHAGTWTAAGTVTTTGTGATTVYYFRRTA